MFLIFAHEVFSEFVVALEILFNDRLQQVYHFVNLHPTVNKD